MFIPPHGLYFRIVARDTQNAIISRNSPTPYVWHTNAAESPEQFFTLIHGTGAHAGTYAIKSKATGNVLYSRTAPEPRVGHISGDGQYNDNWFTFEEGQGDRAGQFRIVCPSTKLAIYSRVNNAPDFGNWVATAVYGDQYFNFVFESVSVTKVEFDLAHARIVSRQDAVTLGSHTFVNTSDGTQDVMETFTISKTINTNSHFVYGTGFAVPQGTPFATILPAFVNGAFIVDPSRRKACNFGVNDAFAQTYGNSFTIKVPVKRALNAVGTVVPVQIQAPYTITLASASGVVVQTTGTWTGLDYTDEKFDVQVA